MAAIAAILDFEPRPKSNGMILGPDLTPPHQVSSKSVKEFFRNTVHKQTNKQTNEIARRASTCRNITLDQLVPLYSSCMHTKFEVNWCDFDKVIKEKVS